MGVGSQTPPLLAVGTGRAKKKIYIYNFLMGGSHTYDKVKNETLDPDYKF